MLPDVRRFALRIGLKLIERLSTASDASVVSVLADRPLWGRSYPLYSGYCQATVPLAAHDTAIRCQSTSSISASQNDFSFPTSGPVSV
jgi:hypothetical protein